MHFTVNAEAPSPGHRFIGHLVGALKLYDPMTPQLNQKCLAGPGTFSGCYGLAGPQRFFCSSPIVRTCLTSPSVLNIHIVDATDRPHIASDTQPDHPPASARSRTSEKHPDEDRPRSLGCFFVTQPPAEPFFGHKHTSKIQKQQSPTVRTPQCAHTVFTGWTLGRSVTN